MIKLQLFSPLNKAPIYFLEETSSTMDVAKELLKQKVISGTVVWANYQTKGRGRHWGRKWLAEASLNLLFTIIIKKNDLRVNESAFPILGGLTICKVLKQKYNLLTSLKWPNDVYFTTQKLAGVLCLTHKDFILSGMGINCNQILFPAELEEKAISLKSILKREIDRLELLQALLNELVFQLSNQNWLKEAEDFLWGKGFNCWFADETLGSDKKFGILLGLTDYGEMKCLISNQEVIIRTGSYGILGKS